MLSGHGSCRDKGTTFAIIEIKCLKNEVHVITNLCIMYCMHLQSVERGSEQRPTRYALLMERGSVHGKVHLLMEREVCKGLPGGVLINGEVTLCAL